MPTPKTAEGIKRWKENMRKAHIGLKLSKETVEKIRKANTGKKISDEARKKMSLARIGKKYPEHSKKLTGKKASEETKAKMSKSAHKGDTSYNWRGDKISYVGLHRWVRRWRGKPMRCEHCGISDRQIQWANKSGEYLRDLKDWISLCVPCHRKYDYKIIKIKNAKV